MDQPVPARIAITEISLAYELSVGDIDQAVGNRHADLHAFHLVAPLGLCWATTRWRRFLRTQC